MFSALICAAGLASSLRHKLGRAQPDDAPARESLTERMGKAEKVVKAAMGTSGGDNAQLAQNIRSRFDACVPCVLAAADVLSLIHI